MPWNGRISGGVDLESVNARQVAQSLIQDVSSQGCCHVLKAEITDSEIRITYVVDRDRYGFVQSHRDFCSGLPLAFQVAVVNAINTICTTERQGPYAAEGRM